MSTPEESISAHSSATTTTTTSQSMLSRRENFPSSRSPSIHNKDKLDLLENGALLTRRSQSPSFSQQFPSSNNKDEDDDDDDSSEEKKLLYPPTDNSNSHHTPLSQRDRRALALLVVLYLLQGIPVGLAFGSIPFLLRSKLSYSQIGIFSLSTYPYSLKLLWSPIVDSIFSPKLGRRKSWIVPIQLIVGGMLWWMGGNVQSLLEVDEPNINLLTGLFFALVFFAATQDIAVDGWALTLLSKENLSYASTAQTIGLNTGYFLSFTVFLAFNSLEFSNAYFRSQEFPLDYPLISLSGYLKFWGVGFVVVTSYLAVFQPEVSILLSFIFSWRGGELMSIAAYRTQFRLMNPICI